MVFGKFVWTLTFFAPSVCTSVSHLPSSDFGEVRRTASGERANRVPGCQPRSATATSTWWRRGKTELRSALAAGGVLIQ